MKKFLFALTLLMTPSLFAEKSSTADPDCLHALKARSIAGKEVKLSRFKGKVVLIVNTASQCGYTPQYKGLQALHDKYEKSGFAVLGFPSNDFRGQEPGTNAEIKMFCELNYKVTFPLFEKGPVKGAETQPVFKFLKRSPAGGEDGEIGWNFTKFLVDKKGHAAARFSTKIDPLDPAVTAKIEELLR